MAAMLVLFANGIAQGSPQPNSISVTKEPLGPVIEFNDGDYVLTMARAVPPSGWERAKTPHIYRQIETGWRTGDFHGLWARHRVDRAALGNGPLALFTVGTRNQFTIYVNGTEIFRNFATEADDKMSWYRPYLAPIPQAALRSGINEITVRTVSRDSLGVGRIVVGPHIIVENHYLWQFFWRITAPMVTSSFMLILGGFTFLLWFVRRQEIELLYLPISITLWFLRNYQYFAEDVPFHLATFNALTVAATLLTIVFTFAFFVTLYKIPHARRMISALVAFTIPYTFIHWYFSLSNFLIYIPTLIIVCVIIYFIVRNLMTERSLENFSWLLLMIMMLMFGTYDAFLASSGHAWKGSDFYLSLFNGFFYSLAFLITFGSRAVRAFSALGTANATLEQRIAETREELAASEAARQTLVVGSAIAGERERLMQEMHDGIGSNLITALAVAEKQKQSPTTIKTLRRALNDLKITVDSLEPVEGDIVALVGNLRHRMAGDLRDAGLHCKWEVRPCGTLPWLDPTNALHVLRIFQEAIGNVLAHSGASEMRIGCSEVECNGMPGIATYVRDNGCGFEVARNELPGKGLSNMQSRATSLHGVLTCESTKDEGSVLTLWLPYQRVMPNSPLSARTSAHDTF